MDDFNLDEMDPSQYDLVISLSQIDQDKAVKIITDTVSYRRFSPMTYSIKCLEDNELASRVRMALLERFPDVRVRANGGKLVVETTALKREKKKEPKPSRKSLEKSQVSNMWKSMSSMIFFVKQQRVSAKRFHVVVTDIRMDEIDGIQVLEHVTEKSPRTKVIMITGYAMMALAREAMEKGAFDFIAKPIQPDDLRKVIARAAKSLGASINFEASVANET